MAFFMDERKPLMAEKDLKETLLDALPPVFTRRTAAKLTGGLLAAGTLANLDCRGRGPSGTVRLGRKIAYRREEFVDWLVGRLDRR